MFFVVFFLVKKSANEVFQYSLFRERLSLKTFSPNFPEKIFPGRDKKTYVSLFTMRLKETKRFSNLIVNPIKRRTPKGYSPESFPGYSPESFTGYSPESFTGYSPESFTGYYPESFTGYYPVSFRAVKDSGYYLVSLYLFGG